MDHVKDSTTSSTENFEERIPYPEDSSNFLTEHLRKLNCFTKTIVFPQQDFTEIRVGFHISTSRVS